VKGAAHKLTKPCTIVEERPSQGRVGRSDSKWALAPVVVVLSRARRLVVTPANRSQGNLRQLPVQNPLL